MHFYNLAPKNYSFYNKINTLETLVIFVIFHTTGTISILRSFNGPAKNKFSRLILLKHAYLTRLSSKHAKMSASVTVYSGAI